VVFAKMTRHEFHPIPASITSLQCTCIKYMLPR